MIKFQPLPPTHREMTHHSSHSTTRYTLQCILHYNISSYIIINGPQRPTNAKHVCDAKRRSDKKKIPS